MNTTSAAASGKNILSVSPEFKKEAVKALTAIVGFILVYFLLLALSLGLVALSFYSAFLVVAAKPSFYTILIGLGLVAFGIMIFVFLVKFMFSTSKEDESDSVELKYEDQPKLFDTIYQLAKETGTSRPKKIFLSADVNACVFYNSSFWSMFLPVRKNLKIGLGLVNVVNTSELKAVIAHEFGHFSQRSMKLGSWVYQVNKVIHDMLYNNRGYAEAIDGIAQIHGILAIFAQINVKVVQAIQWILRQMFKLVNKSYLGLSRQMEFHADLVAASVCGSNNIINSLKRLDFAGACFNSTIGFCNTAWKEKKLVDDFYTSYSLVMKRIAELNHFSFKDGLPVMKESGETVSSRINYKDQWASHPTVEERKQNLDHYLLEADVDTTSAWSLFADQEKWKNLLTKQFYKSIPQQEVQGVISAAEFEQLVDSQLRQFSFPGIFGEYYDNRQIDLFDPNEAVQEPFVIKPFGEVFTKENIQLPKKIVLLQQDIALLTAIHKKEIDVSSFDFDGKKYRVKDASQVLAQLEGELDQKQKELAQLDKILFRYFYAIAPLPEAEALKQSYLHYFNERKEANHFLENVNKMLDNLAPLYQGHQLTIEGIQQIIGNLKQVHEPIYKKLLLQWLDKNIFQNEPALKAQVEKFTVSDYQYFSGTSFFDNELNELNNLAQETWAAITDYLFLQFRSITEQKARFLIVRERELAYKK